MPSKHKIIFFSEGDFSGTLPRNHPNLRMPEVWYSSLNCPHHPINRIHEIPDNSFDIGVIIIPKKLHHLISYPLLKNLKRCCKKIGFMQEGASWIFQDYEIEIQLWFLSLMKSMDFGLAHSHRDLNYYENLLNIPVYHHPTLIIDDSIKGFIRPETEEKVVIGGNLVRYYGGLNSLIIARHFDCPIWSPSMGRKKQEEDNIQELNHFPWMSWADWMKQLSSFKYAIHLNPNTIAGSFNLNCAYWGIPCIGNKDQHTQIKCFPELSVAPDDLKMAKELSLRLKGDIGFYEECSQKSKENYKRYFSEESYLLKMSKTFSTILNED
jgi:hypothetical protein